MYVEYIETLLEEANRAIEAREYKTAERLMQNALYDEPGYAKLHNNLGWLYQYCIENKSKAEIHLKYAIRFDPKIDAAYYNLTDLYLESRKYSELKEVMEDALKLDGSNKELVYQNLAKVYEASHQFTKAIKYYRMALYETIDSYDAGELKRSIKRCRYKKFKRLF